MRQEVTRAHKGWALDSVVLHNDVIKQMKEDITGPPGVINSRLNRYMLFVHKCWTMRSSFVNGNFQELLVNL